jgi:hypothetical protein
MRRKDRERAILQLVYDPNQFATVCESEKPDFKLRHHKEDKFFGVEITEFYLFESDARIKSIPGYLSELFAGGKPRHRDDVDSLKVTKARLRRSGESREELIDAIVRELLEVSAYVRMIAAAIERKDQKLISYESGLDHVNLIVLDHSHRFRTLSPEYFYSFFFTQDLCATLVQTGFREVFFVTVFKEQGRVYIPLKLLFLLAHFYMFYWASEEHQPLKQYDFIRAELEPFVEYMQRRGVSIVFTAGPDSETELLWSNYGICVDDSGITIRDYADFKLPRPITPFRVEASGSLLDPQFIYYVEDFMKQNTFVSDMSKPVIRDAPL